MTLKVSAAHLLSDAYTIVAVSLAWSGLDERARAAWLEPKKLSQVSYFTGKEGWRLLGYDVADHFLLSALANCGYPSEDLAIADNRWGGFLNENGLFGQVEAAESYRMESDARVPEHAPFSVFGMYQIGGQ